MEGLRPIEPVNVPEEPTVHRCRLELAAALRRVSASGLFMITIEQADRQPLVPKRQLADWVTRASR